MQEIHELMSTQEKKENYVYEIFSSMGKLFQKREFVFSKMKLVFSKLMNLLWCFSLANFTMHFTKEISIIPRVYM